MTIRPELLDELLKDFTKPEDLVGEGGIFDTKELTDPALAQVFPTTRVQRYWLHKTANVLNNLPNSQQPQAKSALHQIYLAETKADAQKAFERFIKTYDAKYPKAVECLSNPLFSSSQRKVER